MDFAPATSGIAAVVTAALLGLAGWFGHAMGFFRSFPGKHTKAAILISATALWMLWNIAFLWVIALRYDFTFIGGFWRCFPVEFCRPCRASGRLGISESNEPLSTFSRRLKPDTHPCSTSKRQITGMAQPNVRLLAFSPDALDELESHLRDDISPGNPFRFPTPKCLRCRRSTHRASLRRSKKNSAKTPPCNVLSVA